MQAMILAAGLGTRLLPHTLIRPKPLFPILNRPLLNLTINRLQRLGFDHIVVNCHFLRRQILTVLDAFSGVKVQEEECVLGTGGGLRLALQYLRDEPLLVTNGDIYHLVDLVDLYRYHTARQNLVTMAMHDYPRFNNVTVQDDKVLGFDGHRQLYQLAFTGLHVVEPAVLQDIKCGVFSSIIDRYRNLLLAGGDIGCYRTDDRYWADMGTVNDYLVLHEGLLLGTVPRWQELGPVDKPFCIAQGAKIPLRVKMRDWACIGNAQIKSGSHIERVVVWDEVVVQRDSRLVDVIASS